MTSGVGPGYTARLLDPETAVTGGAQPNGLYYYRARMYSPTLGRFLQPDPIGVQGGVNLYAYADNDPLDQTDPSGKDPFIGATVGAIAGGYYGALGAIAQGGSPKAIIISSLVGGGIGAAVGALDPSFGVATLAIVGGGAAGLGDVAGQVITNAAENKPLGNINYGSTVGAVAGGALGGAGGTVLGGLGVSAGLSELTATALGASISSGPGTLLPAIGGAISDQLSGAAAANENAPVGASAASGGLGGSTSAAGTATK